MHIACMIGSLSKGGSERVMCNLIQYFIEHNHQVTLVTQYKGNDEYPLDDRVNRIISDINPERVGNNRVLNFRPTISCLISSAAFRNCEISGKRRSRMLFWCLSERIILWHF